MVLMDGPYQFLFLFRTDFISCYSPSPSLIDLFTPRKKHNGIDALPFIQQSRQRKHLVSKLEITHDDMGLVPHHCIWIQILLNDAIKIRRT